MKLYKRDFKGVWIPKEIWIDTRLNMLEKGILTEIDSLDVSERGCYASNKYLAEFCQCSETKVSMAVKKLVKLGYIYVESFDGRQRILKSRLSNFERQTLKKCKADFKKLKESKIDNKTNNNICDVVVDDTDRMEIYKDKVMLTDKQMTELLDIMGLDVFTEYIEKLNTWIVEKNANVKNHYTTILKWYNEDRGVESE